LSSDGSVSAVHLAMAIAWAVTQGAQIICAPVQLDFFYYLKHRTQNLPHSEDDYGMVWGKTITSDYRAILRLFDGLSSILTQMGALIVVPCGNDHWVTGSKIDGDLPAVIDGFISVGAVEKTDDGLSIAQFSNNGADVLAPGGKIVCANPGGGTKTL